MHATLLDSGNNPLVGKTITFAVTGANPTSGTAITDSSGVASFSYTGQNNGTDTVQASYLSLQSNAATVSWVTPIASVSTTKITGRFYSGGCGSFCANVKEPPVFTQDFPTIDFNPPGGTIPGNITGVGVDTRPFTDITTNPAGDFTGAVVAQGNGSQAGVGNLGGFDAVFTGTYLVAQAGNITFNFYSDDGFIFGAGGGATRVSGADSNPPSATELEGYPVMGAYNQPTSPVANSITVNFPAPGSYPYEVDYSECCGGQVALTMANAATGIGVPPAGNLSITPVNIPTQTIGQAAKVTIAAMDASGQPISGVPVTLTISGPNGQTLDCSNDASQCLTDAHGLAVFSYVGHSPGTDLVLAGASVDGSPAVSNTVAVPWDFGSGSSSAQPPVDITGIQPADGTVVSQPVPITANFAPPAGQAIASWKVTYQALDPGPEVTLAQGTGTPPNPMATFDPTVLPNDSYAINVYATASGGGTQETTTTVAVYGNLKMGRFLSTFQDMNVPVNGFPMQVRRTYDSFDKTVGDFGVGWHVSVSNFHTAANRQLGAGGWTEYATSCFILCNYAYKTSAPHYVTVTFPDGHQEVFDFTPQGPSLALIDFANATTQFTARAGTDTTSTLQDARGPVTLSYGFDGNLYDNNNLPYNPTRFQLTLHDGTVLILDVNTGLVSEADRNGNTLTVDSTGLHSSTGASINFTRDGLGRITQITGPSGQVLNYAYSGAGDLASFTDASGNSETYTYDSTHNVLAVNGTGGAALQTLIYDSAGRLTAVTDGSGHTTTISNDVAGRQQTTLDPAGQLTTVYTYDPVGDVVRIDQTGGTATRTTTYTYDSAGNILSRTDPLGHTTTATYDGNGDQLSLTDPSGHVTHFTYNSNGQPTSVVLPDGSVQSSTYDSAGDLTSVIHADGTSSSYTYDSAGNAISITDPSGGVAHYTYDSAGRVKSVADPLGSTTSYTYDASGNLLTLTDPRGGVTGYTYDADGRITGVTDALGHTQRFTYDGLGRLASQTDAVGGTSSYTYDAGGQLSNVVTRDAAAINYSYTPDGEMSQVALPGGVTDNYTYDVFGELTGASNANATDTFSYDAGGDILSQGVSGPAQPTATVSYTYNLASNRFSMTSPTGTVHYTYDAANRLVGETDPAGHSFGMSYNANGQLSSITRPNGVNDSLTYASGGNLTNLVASAGGPTLAQASYAYDAAGQRTSLTTTSGSTAYTYDASHDLTGAGGTAYAYDGSGNRTGTGYAYDAADRMVTSPGATYNYDAEGNRISRTDSGGVTSYTWDPLHELTSVTYPDTSTSTYKYDALGRRVQVTDGSTVTRYLYDGTNAIATYDGTNTLTTGYVNGLGTDSLLEIVRGSNVYYPVQDGANSIVALTDGTGAVVERYTYDAYGGQTATGSVSQPFTFTGREFDGKSGLYYYRARYYDPATGTFLSEDPSIGGNPYSYALDAPTNYIDPTGGEAITEEAFLTLETNNLDKARAFQKLNACLGGQLLLLSLAMDGFAVTPPDESALVSRAFANAYISFLPSQLQGLAQHFINSDSGDAASTDGGSSWETKVADKIKEKVQDKVKEKVEGKVADWLHLPEGTSDFVDGLVSATDTAQSVADAANAVAAGDCATAMKLIGDLCAPG